MELWNDNGYNVDLEVDLSALIVTGSGVTNTLTRNGNGNVSAHISGSANSPQVSFALPPFPRQIQDSSIGRALRGFQLSDVTLAYVIGTAAATSMTFAAYTYAVTDGSAPGTNGTAFGGTFTFNEGTSAGIAIPVTNSANGYVVQCVPAAGAAVVFNLDNAKLWFNWNWTNGTNGTVDIYSVTIHGVWLFRQPR